MAWQDGTIKQGLDLMSLFPISDPPDHGFLAGQYLLEKGPIGKRRLCLSEMTVETLRW